MELKTTKELLEDDVLYDALRDIFYYTDTDIDDLTEEQFAGVISALMSYGQCQVLNDKLDQVDSFLATYVVKD